MDENKVPEGAEAPVSVDENGNPVVKPEVEETAAPATDTPAA